MRQTEKIAEEAIVILLFIASSSVYLATTAGIASSNDGSNLALAKSIVDNGTFSIDSYWYLTGFIDYAENAGKKYSDRAPGTAFAAVPLYLIGKASASMMPAASYSEGLEPDNPAVAVVLMLPVIAGALTVVLTYLISRTLGYGRYSSIIAAATLAFGTLLWKYSAMLYSHSLSAFLLTSAIYMTLTLKDQTKQTLRLSLLFLTLGYMMIVEYPNILLSAAIAAYLVYEGRLKGSQIAIAAASIATPIILLLAYNQVNFGSPLETAYDNAPHHPWAGQLTTAFTTPLQYGLTGLLIGAKEIRSGILFLTPALLLAILGIPYLIKKNPRQSTLILSLSAIHLVLYGMHKTWYGGGSADARYLLTITPLLTLPLAAWVETHLLPNAGTAKAAIIQAAAFSLITISAINALTEIAIDHTHGTAGYALPVNHLKDLTNDTTTALPSIKLIPPFLGVMLTLYAIAAYKLKRLPGLDTEKNKYQNASMILAIAAITGITAALLVLGSTPA